MISTLSEYVAVDRSHCRNVYNRIITLTIRCLMIRSHLFIHLGHAVFDGSDASTVLSLVKTWRNYIIENLKHLIFKLLILFLDGLLNLLLTDLHCLFFHKPSRLRRFRLPSLR